MAPVPPGAALFCWPRPPHRPAAAVRRSPLPAGAVQGVRGSQRPGHTAGPLAGRGARLGAGRAGLQAHKPVAPVAACGPVLCAACDVAPTWQLGRRQDPRQLAPGLQSDAAGSLSPRCPWPLWLAPTRCSAAHSPPCRRTPTWPTRCSSWGLWTWPSCTTPQRCASSPPSPTRSTTWPRHTCRRARWRRCGPGRPGAELQHTRLSARPLAPPAAACLLPGTR